MGHNSWSSSISQGTQTHEIWVQWESLTVFRDFDALCLQNENY